MTTYILSFAAGLLAALSPCVLPIIPIVVGSSVQKYKLGPLVLAAGVVSAFVTFGLTFSILTNIIGIQEDHIRIASAYLLLFFGITLLFPLLRERISNLFLPLANKSTELSRRFDNLGLFGQFFIGALLGSAWSPCVGPTLGMAMTMAVHESQRFEASLIMTMFGIGLITPILGIAYSFKAFFRNHRVRLMNFSKKGTRFLGVALAAIAFLILTGADKKLEAQIVQYLPSWYLEISSGL